MHLGLSKLLLWIVNTAVCVLAYYNYFDISMFDTHVSVYLCGSSSSPGAALLTTYDIVEAHSSLLVSDLTDVEVELSPLLMASLRYTAPPPLSGSVPPNPPLSGSVPPSDPPLSGSVPPSDGITVTNTTAVPDVFRMWTAVIFVNLTLFIQYYHLRKQYFRFHSQCLTRMFFITFSFLP